MADFTPAVTLTLQHEGGFFHNAATGEVVNMGVTLATLRSLGILKSSGPALQSDVEFVRSLTEDEAKDIYHMEYWAPLQLDHINSQDVANKVFDLGVNMGISAAAHILQVALLMVPADGIVGPRTIAAANSADPAKLLSEIREAAKRKYQEIAYLNPALASNLPGWLNRLNQA